MLAHRMVDKIRDFSVQRIGNPPTRIFGTLYRAGRIVLEESRGETEHVAYAARDV
jgi:hypothetical protein